MKISLRTSTLALAFMLAAGPFATLDANAKSTFMTDCSTKYKAAKADGSIDAATKWTDYMKTVCKADAASADAPGANAAAPAATPVKAAKPATTPMEATTTPSGSFMQNCSTSWKAMKASNTVPAGLKWKDFVAAKCVATPAAAPATTAAASKPTAPMANGALPASFVKKCGDDWKAMKSAGTVPDGLTWKDFVIGKCVAKPAGGVTTASASNQTFLQKCSTDWKAMKAANTVPDGMAWKDFIAAKCTVDGMPAAKPASVKKAVAVAPAEPTNDDPAIKLVDKNGKPFTAGQLAAHERARTCGAKWRAEKASGTVDASQKWPQYWSKCNAEIKAAAQ